MNNQTFETSKTVKYNVNSIIKKMNERSILFNHSAQRADEQWSLAMKSNLISDIIQGNPIPAIVCAEQVINGVSIIWNLDGKQRCTNVYSYVNNQFKIAKSVVRNVIKYQVILRDENGNVITDSNGIPKVEWKEFDIVNKKFSQLPQELQDRIMDYCFEVTLYLNCADEDIIYHISRYNSGKAMNQSQKGIIKLGEYASDVKRISGSDFFADCGSYTIKEEKSGAINRIVVETVMASNFLDDWKKNQETMCEYINTNATQDMFDEVEDNLDELCDVVTDKHNDLFTTKDSFVWFTSYKKAKENGFSCDEFGEFLDEVVDNLHSTLIDGISLDSLNENRNTKDKSVITLKINHIMNMLEEFRKVA